MAAYFSFAYSALAAMRIGNIRATALPKRAEILIGRLGFSDYCWDKVEAPSDYSLTFRLRFSFLFSWLAKLGSLLSSTEKYA
jgi:hypothetical protein